jgi:hypothetical protein
VERQDDRRQRLHYGMQILFRILWAGNVSRAARLAEAAPPTAQRRARGLGLLDRLATMSIAPMIIRWRPNQKMPPRLGAAAAGQQVS